MNFIHRRGPLGASSRTIRRRWTISPPASRTRRTTRSYASAVVAGRPTELRGRCMHFWLVFYIVIFPALEARPPHASVGGGAMHKTLSPDPLNLYMYISV